MDSASMEGSMDDPEARSGSDVDSLEKTLLSISELDDPNTKAGQYASDAETDSEAETSAATVVNKKKYPYGPLFFIMAATTGQR